MRVGLVQFGGSRKLPMKERTLSRNLRNESEWGLGSEGGRTGHHCDNLIFVFHVSDSVSNLPRYNLSIVESPLLALLPPLHSPSFPG